MRDKYKTILAYATVFVLASTLMLLYEFVKEIFTQGKLSLWESHAITIIITALISTISAVYISRKFKAKENELRLMNEKLHELSIKDELTQVNNRRSFNFKILNSWELCSY